MNILYIAFSCSPFHGSEDKIGWKIPLVSSRNNYVVVLTREDQRKYIETYMEENPHTNIRFEYVDIPEIYKKTIRKFPFSVQLNIWHKRAYETAKEICEREHIDIVHQITPVEFRSIGNYGKIPGVKFVCGPIAGGQAIPKELMRYVGARIWIEWLREIINSLSRMLLRIHKKEKYCDGIFFANKETEQYLCNCFPEKKRLGIQIDIAAESQGLTNSKKMTGTPLQFLVVGRMVYLKGHAYLLDALARLPNEMEYECHLVGTGSVREGLERQCTKLALNNRVYFDGQIPYGEMKAVYQKADILIMPSFREATGSVILEAMENGLPVITINKFGGATIVNEDNGWLYEGNTQEEYIENLKNTLMECIQNPEEVRRRGENARECAKMYTWEEKVKTYQEIYERLIKEK